MLHSLKAMRNALLKLTVPLAVLVYSGRGAGAEVQAGRLEDSVLIERDIEYGRVGERSLKLDILRPRTRGNEPRPVIVANRVDFSKTAVVVGPWLEVDAQSERFVGGSETGGSGERARRRNLPQGLRDPRHGLMGKQSKST